MIEKQPSGEIVSVSVTTDESLALVSRYLTIAASYDTGEPRPIRPSRPAVEVPYTFVAGAAKGIRSAFERAAAGQTTQDEAEILIAQEELAKLNAPTVEPSTPDVETILWPTTRAVREAGRRVAALAFGSLNL